MENTHSSASPMDLKKLNFLQINLMNCRRINNGKRIPKKNVFQSTVRSKIKKKSRQLAARKNLIQMSSITIVTVIPDFQGTYQQLALIILFFHT
jgi:hypothetical protein